MRQEMVTEFAKNAIWDELLEASRAERYFAAIADRHPKRKKWRSAIHGIVGGIAAISFLSPSLDWLVSIAGLLLVIVVIFSDHILTHKADILASVQRNISQLARDYRRLFELANNEQIDDAAARHTMGLLSGILSNACSRVNVPVDDDLVPNTQEAAFKVESERYAT